ncbi:RHTO0S09e03026g1_1 [Rhodotorula toruloides]|uniref:RHTO0S09e03026g1_1 n=2 Tax=Rhodotorula toruloides TaxID=5286 RepID=A0A061B4D5_RHOTO|nr:exopolyphosphatase [Rhodotorula toruloides NP11]EMS22929.1 exopolyphosphatase [Rhodotorula toruloides NP11]CDR44356.1 RHTO0S09e03026g1_1 [Rhodotorula toruloides]
MRWLPLLAASALSLAPAVLTLPADSLEARQQTVISSSDLLGEQQGQGSAAGFMHGSEEEHTGTGWLSQWSRQNKDDFLEALRNNNADEYIVVMGNEAGDLDSLVSAVALSFMYNHLDPPQKAVALLQTEQDALDLRPENALALHYAKMSSGHRDLLTADELPIKPVDMGHRIKGIALVDHNVPRSDWSKARISAIIDHHEDRGFGNDTANPRIIERSGSCSSLVTRYVLDNLPGADKAYPIPPAYEMLEYAVADNAAESQVRAPLPQELVELLLRTIAIDSSGLDKDSRQPVDVESASRLFARSSWRHRKLKEVMDTLDKDLKASRRALDGLDVRSLLRRDWKGDSIPTQSKKYPHIALGFASSPVSLEEQINRTPEGTAPEWFAIERAWTAEIQADVSVALTNFRDHKTGEKTRQIALVVAHGYGKRLHEGSANRLFKQLRHAIEHAGVKDLDKWHRPDKKPLLARRAVYQYQGDYSRKFWRPILENVVKEWEG